MTAATLSAQDLLLVQDQAWLLSALLVAVIVGGMRTTRRGLLQTLHVCAGELWGKMCVLAPHHVIASSLHVKVSSSVRRQMRTAHRRVVRALMGRKVLLGGRRLASKAKHGVKHSKKRLNKTVTLYRKMPLKAMSRLWGRFNQLELPIFLRRPLLSLYVWMFGCRLDEAEIEDLRYYRNLGEFFRRELKPHVRPIDDDHVLTSPSDGKILYYGRVDNGILEQVKGVTYSLRGFLGPQTWLGGQPRDINHMCDAEYQQHLALHPDNDLFHCIIYLAPGDYHRFHSPTNWTLHHRRHFPGELLSVNPGIARWVQGLFNFNERAVYTGQWDHGFFSMCAVGATNVGSIKIYCDEDLKTNIGSKYPEGTYFDKVFQCPVQVAKGSMFGEFNLGSTIVLIFEAPKGFQFKVHEGQKIRFGQALGTSP